MATRFKVCAGAATHEFNASRIERLIVGVPVDTGTVVLRHGGTDDNILPLTTSGAVPYEVEVNYDGGRGARAFELVITEAQTVTVFYDG